MGSKYPILKAPEIVKAIESFGFVYKSQKDSHAKYIRIENDGQTRIAIIPMHYEIAKGTLKSILEQAGISLDEFLNKL